MPNRKLVVTLTAVALIVTSCASSTSTSGSTSNPEVTTSAAAASTPTTPSSTVTPQSGTSAKVPDSTAAATTSAAAKVAIACGDGSPAVIQTLGWCERRSTDPELIVAGVAPPPQCIYRKDEVLVPNETTTSSIKSKLPAGSSAGVLSESIGESGYKRLQFTGADPIVVADRIPGAVPNYLFASAMGWTFGPGGDVKDRGNASPKGSRLDATAPASVTIAVLDTGFDVRAGISATPLLQPAALKGYLSSKSGVAPPTWPAPNSADPDEVDVGITAGHGTFIASLLKHLLPDAAISIGQIPSWLTDVTENGQSFQVAATDTAIVAATLSNPGLKTADYLNLSLGSYGCPPDVKVGDTTNTWWRSPVPVRNALLELSKPRVFAAAGNDATKLPFYPAAWGACGIPSGIVNGIGVECSLAADSDKREKEDAAISAQVAAVGSNACKDDCATKGAAGMMDHKSFSNNGDWVEYNAEGAEVVGYRPDTFDSAAAKRTQPKQPKPAKMYEWSGTSFATPCALALAAAGRALSAKPTVNDCGLGA